MLCLTGQIATPMIGRGFGMLHEIPDQLAIIRGLTKWAARIEHPTQVQRLVDEAFYQLKSGRPRPVGLEIPPDVLTWETDVTFGDNANGAQPIAPDTNVFCQPVMLPPSLRE